MLAVNHCSCRKGRRYVGGAFLMCAALAAMAMPIRAHAEVTGTASATGQFERNSNVFDLTSGAAPPGANSSQRSDTFFAYGADFEGKEAWGRQELFAKASSREFDYQRFTDLDHNDFSVDVGLNWKLADLLDGKLDVARARSMVPLMDLTGSALGLSLMTQQSETAQINFKLNSDWKLVGLGYTSKADEPIAGAPNLQLTQSSGTASIDYLGFGALTSGFTVGYLSGNYGGSYGNLGPNGTVGSSGTVNPTYSQTSAGFLANYKLNRTAFEGQIGFSRRDSGTASDNTSGVTGLFDLKYQLTPKTSYTVKIDRTINSYFLNAGSEIDTDANGSVNWQATYKLAVSLGYAFTYRDYPGQGNNPVGSNRVDTQQGVNMNLNYQPRHWLVIRPYASVQTRRSNFIGGHYSSNTFGVFVTASYPDRPK